MPDPLDERAGAIELLRSAAIQAERFLADLDTMAAAPAGVDEAASAFGGESLPALGTGGREAIAELVDRGLPAATRSAGPRFFHFVTGGGTPAALAADWLTSAIDQN